MKWNSKLKRVFKKIKLYMTLPHIWVLFVITILALVMCMLAITYKAENEFLSSIFANIFAGLLTGVIICLITTIKSVSLYRTECKIMWLENLHKECLDFISMYKNMTLSRKDTFKDDIDYNNYIYDVLCCGNGISHTISQSRFNESLPFNSYKYCRKKFSFDAVEVMKENNLLHDEIIRKDVSKLSNAEIRKLFNRMEHKIVILNGEIIKTIEALRTKQKAINISIG